jgi:hypothetical protein
MASELAAPTVGSYLDSTMFQMLRLQAHEDV